jgi:hypothetical protein
MRRRQRGLLFVCALTVAGILASVLWSYNALADGDGDEALATRLGLPICLAGLLVATWTIVAGRRDTDRAKSLDDSADTLARRIRQQWEAAEDLHRLNHDYALSVSWHSEDEGLTDDLSSVRAMPPVGPSELPTAVRALPWTPWPGRARTSGRFFASAFPPAARWCSATAGPARPCFWSGWCTTSWRNGAKAMQST